MDSITPRKAIALAGLAGLLLGATTFAACKMDGAAKAKKVLSQYGTIEAEWEIRDEEAGKTFTYVLLRNKSGTHETYELITEDGRQTFEREQAGGIDGTGCYLYPHGLTTRWIEEQPPKVLEDSRESGEKTRTKCLEYKDMAAWQYVPEEDKEAAKPPPPPPKEPAPAADAGTPDAGGADAGASSPLESPASADPADEDEGPSETGDDDDPGLPDEVESALPL